MIRSDRIPNALLVSLRDPFLDSDRIMPPMGIMALHSYLMSRNIQSRIENDFDLEHLEKYKDYSHLCISCMTPQKSQAYAILKAVKGVAPETVVVIGGPHASFYLAECKAQPFDHIVVGDGELALGEILSGGSDCERVLDRPMTETQMNALPPPFRDSAFINQYQFYFQGVRASTILTAKGCPMSCAFCEDARTRVRMYSPEYVGVQIRQVKEAGYQGVMFFDDVMTLSKKRVRDLTQEIAKHDILFRCFGHARTMSGDIADMLRGAGCIETGVGMETGSQRILDAVQKKTTVEQNRRYVLTCNSRGIRVKAFFILGLPGETEETIAETERFLQFLMDQKIVGYDGKIIRNDFDMTIFFPYLGTDIRRRMDAGDGGVDLMFTENPDLKKGFYKGVQGSSEIVVRTRGMSAEALSETQKRLVATYKAK
ncbi:MAG: B12-binding protein [Magnetococcales bacterium]|nr:B12-binding protein [Magnetococcales bacterium]HIJ84300.1 B12-binding domain-containing radical SAM protein [Magnetococcales bacterium]